MTSSPTSSISSLPPGSKARTAAPSARHCSSPRYTGSVGQPPTNAVHTSVPPLVEIEMQEPLLELLDQDGPVPLDDRLRQPGRAGGVEHPQRVVERDLLEGQFVVEREQLVPGHRLAQALEVAALVAEPGVEVRQ